MTINKMAYTALVAFVSMILTLIVAALLGDVDANARQTAPGISRDITAQELAQHAGRDSCWKAIGGKVYDVTAYIPLHPTSEEVMLEWCGKSADEGWLNKRPGRPHSPAAAAMLESYLIGRLVLDEARPALSEAPAPEPSTPASTRPDGKVLLGLAPGTYLDGRYRGMFSDRGEIEVTIQFDLRDGRLHDISYRHLTYRGFDYLKLQEGEEFYPVLVQHRRIASALEGKPLETIFRLYTPESMVEDVDGFTGATVRGNKLISAIRDGLNRGVYQWR